ncbi:MAG TPA: hypothetical protein VF008_32080 [Niastella sp.]
MQHLILVLAIIFLTIIAGNGRGKGATGKKPLVMKMQKPKAKKASTAFPADRLSVYYSRFDMIVN